MPSAELALEVLALALESTRGTAVTPPTHLMPFSGMIKPNREKYRPNESRGTLEEFYRSKTVRANANWSGSGALDPNYAPILFNLIAKGVTSPSTPTNGVLTRLWSFVPTITADDLKSATLYGGDPNVQIFQSAFAMADTLTISADASGTDGATWGMDGMALFPTRVAAPTLPAQAVGSILAPGAMQMWIDTSSAIGTTEVTGRFLKTDWSIPTGNTYKYYAAGPTSTLGYTKAGRTKRHATATVVVELNDTSIGVGKEYRTFEADTVAKVRIRLNGSLIESVTPDYYEYVQLDVYGPLAAFDWGDAFGSNRTMQFTIESEYNSTLGASFALYVQNQLTAL